MRMNIVAMGLLLGMCCPLFATDDAACWRELSVGRNAYRKALGRVRKGYGGAYKLPAVDFFLFGMGDRDKYLYADGQLRNALTNRVVQTWEVAEEFLYLIEEPK